MNRSIPLVVLAMAILAFATVMLVVGPKLQIGSEPSPPGLRPYTAQELRGRQQYISLGCVYCHSQQPRTPDQAPDAERGWGRASVAADYAYDYPHLMGTMRTGPDLFNVGARLPSAAWQLTHLYQPRAVSPWSIMPAYPFLFETKDRAAPGDLVVWLPPKQRIPGKVVVAKPEARDLVAYLLSLDHTYPVPADAIRDDGYAKKAAGK
ncbi:cbb3-type cytochrome c oxidase subunit II [Sphingomonas sp. H39-1-10]|uniref:cbb3-type cytochrome c oxidase subunit II n=1 Tax=Sphingomonas pollutisoli TaxID=3030829 RepID=UPI0023B9B18A|nr:cbb3-type cytochrome c oxidase subunit II [Sphingomonas pollutisoli]MDF0491348.1 cbb3-type cytochrome c oxidase subunit II [Sphingomonas pollutisoli]